MATQNKFFIVIYKENVKVALKHQNICKAIYRILLYRRIVMREILTINCIESVNIYIYILQIAVKAYINLTE